ncbi:uncharacterized protein VTP21DRAFT_6178 [Calcarisporiella thermophila]|uniref:uncharacterized protein n=1 Tax=Calcarisporiella thermophila TaxID=911321 RepID=UPI0037447500
MEKDQNSPQATSAEKQTSSHVSTPQKSRFAFFSDTNPYGKPLHTLTDAEIGITDPNENSPIKEVRETISNRDDPNMPCMTFRMWFIGLFFVVIFGFINQMFQFHYPPFLVSAMVVQLLSYPIGRFFAWVLPTQHFRIPFSNATLTLNPGPFNIKEHVLIVSMANVTLNTAYAVDIVVIKKLFYHSDMGFFAGFLLVVTTQCLGYGLAGMLRQFLVRPSAMIWPTNLPTIALFRSFHEHDKEEDMVDEDASVDDEKKVEFAPSEQTTTHLATPTSSGNKKNVRRLRFFLLAAMGSFVYYLFPGFLFNFLTSISWVCLAAPNSHIANQLGSGYYGLSLGAFSLDWNTISSTLLSPLMVPFYVQVNVIIGFIIFAWIALPAGYYTNVLDAMKYPIYSVNLFNSKDASKKYDIAQVAPENKFDPKLLDEYGAPRMSIMFAFNYALGFANLTAVLTHVFLYYRHDIIRQFRKARSEDDDIHAKLMRRYPEVPHIWYLIVLVINLILAFVVCVTFGINLPWWGVLLAIVMCAFFMLPVGIVQAVTTYQVGLNIITEFVIGLLHPGEPIANQTFKTYGYISMYQALGFTADLKLGHYMKVPPRAMFWAQVVATLVGGVINLSTAYFMMGSIPNICQEDAGMWSCAGYSRVFYSASVLWGLVGPKVLFGPTTPYGPLLYGFLIGLVLPIPFYFLGKKYPNSWLRFVNIPAMLAALGYFAQTPPVSYPSWFLVGFIFQYLIKRYRHTWWSNYNYLLSAGLDAGIGLCLPFIFFAFQFKDSITADWWGNHDDSAYCPLAKKPLIS